VGFVVDKVAPGQVFSEYFGFPCQFSFHQLFHSHHHHPGLEQLVVDVPSELSLTPPQETKKKTKNYIIKIHSSIISQISVITWMSISTEDISTIARTVTVRMKTVTSEKLKI
jgi:hypothetical protein